MTSEDLGTIRFIHLFAIDLYYDVWSIKSDFIRIPLTRFILIGLCFSDSHKVTQQFVGLSSAFTLFWSIDLETVEAVKITCTPTIFPPASRTGDFITWTYRVSPSLRLSSTASSSLPVSTTRWSSCRYFSANSGGNRSN